MNPIRFRVFVVAFLTSTLISSTWAQMSMEKVAAVDQTLQSVKAAYNRLPANKRPILDGGSNLVHLADFWHRVGMRFTDPAFMARLQQHSQMQPQTGGAAVTAATATTSGTIPVSATGLLQDVAGSTLAGFTQSESSTARCGTSVVVGFNDTGGIFETPLFLTGAGGESAGGYAYSNNGGQTFVDGGAIDPGPEFWQCSSRGPRRHLR